MAVKFFGQFLVEGGIISREKLLAALELQEATNLKFGEMALSMGMITEEDVERVHLSQRSEDMRFGDIAVRIGVLTEAQVQQVLTRQQNSYLYIGRALVEVGALDEAQLEHWLQEFQKDQAAYRVEKVTIPSGAPVPQVWEVVADLTHKMLARVVNLSFRPGQCEVVDQLNANHTVVAMDLKGSVKARYYFSVTAEIRDVIAKAILGEESVQDEPEEVLDDTVMEFVNIICGNVAAKGAQLGFTIEITPPELLHPAAPLAVPSGHMGLLFPIHVASGDLVEMAVFLEKWGV